MLLRKMKRPLLLAVIATFAAGCASTEPIASVMFIAFVKL
jgi:hypothetical protein